MLVLCSEFIAVFHLEHEARFDRGNSLERKFGVPCVGDGVLAIACIDYAQLAHVLEALLDPLGVGKLLVKA